MDVETWSRLISRADQIAHSLNPKQAGLVFNSLGRFVSRHHQPSAQMEEFVSRYSKRMLGNVLPHCSALDVAQLVHGLVACETWCFPPRLIDEVSNRIIQVAGEFDVQSLSMVALAISKMKSSAAIRQEVVRAIVSRGLGIDVNEQCFSQILNCASTVSSSGGTDQIAQFCLKNIALFETMSIRSLCVTVSALGKLKYADPEILHLVSCRVFEDKAIAVGASLQQLAIIMRSLQKSKVTDHLVYSRLMDIIRMRKIESDIDSRNACNLITALSHANCSVEFMQGVIESTGIVHRKLHESEGIALVAAFVRFSEKSQNPAWAKDLVDKLIRSNTDWNENSMRIVEGLTTKIQYIS